MKHTLWTLFSREMVLFNRRLLSKVEPPNSWTIIPSPRDPQQRYEHLHQKLVNILWSMIVAVHAHWQRAGTLWYGRKLHEQVVSAHWKDIGSRTNRTWWTDSRRRDSSKWICPPLARRPSHIFVSCTLYSADQRNSDVFSNKSRSFI